MNTIIPWGLIIAHLKNESTTEQDVLFDTWIADEDNNQLFQQLSILWKEIQTESSQQNPDIAASWQKMQARIRSGQPKKKAISRNIAYKITAIAASLLLILGISYAYIITNSNNQIHTHSIVSGKSKLILPDGSTVWLNAGSTIQYASSFSRNREIKLEGEASFEVVKDKSHPFIVSASDVQVKVHGTNFNVTSYPKEENIKIALNEGSVSILQNNGNESFLHPGEMAIVNKKDQSLSIEKTDMELEMFWANESVYFKNKSLGYICKYLERWYNVDIDVDPEIAGNLQYTFTIKDDSLESILRTMAKINPMIYSFDENNGVKIMKYKP